MALKKCDWCGQLYTPMFSGDRDLGNEFMNQMGLGLFTSVGKGIGKLAGKKNFCSAECKQAWKEDYEMRKANGQLTAGEQMREEISAPIKETAAEIVAPLKEDAAEIGNEFKNELKNEMAEPTNQIKDQMKEQTTQIKDQMKKSFGAIGGMFKGFGKKK